MIYLATTISVGHRLFALVGIGVSKVPVSEQSPIGIFYALTDRV